MSTDMKGTEFLMGNTICIPVKCLSRDDIDYRKVADFYNVDIIPRLVINHTGMVLRGNITMGFIRETNE